MSSAKRRGQARGQPTNPADGSARRGANPARGRVVAPFDGPASRGSGSGAGSQSHVSAPATSSRRGSDAGSQSQAPSAGAAVQVAPPVARDPAREGDGPRASDSIKNVDMPASFYNIDGLYALPTEFTKRTAFNDTGKAIQLPLNSYQVAKIPTDTIFQYDVVIGNGAEKRMVQAKVWQSKKRQAATGPDMIYDGNKLAWSLDNYGQIKTMVDLDEEQGRPPSKDGKNAFRIHINQTKRVDLSSVQAYLDGKIQFNVNILEGMNFLDHLLREGPSQNPRLVPVRRSFFARNGARMDLGGSIEVFRGVYQSVRAAQSGKLVVNLDVSNSCFWKPQPLVNTILQKNGWRDAAQIATRLNNKGELIATQKYLKKLSVKAAYPGNKQPNNVWKIEKIAEVTPTTHRIEWRDQTGKSTGEKITVQAYFARKYNVNLKMPNLRMIQMTKKMRGEPVYFPMELLVVVEHQRYGAKLDENQTAAMIKFAVSVPRERGQAIEDGKTWLDWKNDKFMSKYGLQISQNQIVTQARVLPPPAIRFGKNKMARPETRGRWDLKATEFFSTPTAELVSWGIGFFPGNISYTKAQLEKFAADFARQYRGHGGKVSPKPPCIMPLNIDAGFGVQELYQATGNMFKAKPQIMIFIVQNRNATHYLRIKKSCDVRFGCVSQVMQGAQVLKMNPQYFSNVLMKFNAKLGGCTSQAAPAPTSGFKGQFTAPTLFIGADVSHASPGSEQPSMAALTVSMDRHAGRYAAGCQTNGRRVEMITEANIREILGPLLQYWMTSVGGGRAPQQVYYMRDGVSEGQFVKVMNEEVPHIRALLDKLAGDKWGGKITVIVASKRHHIRAFPKGSDGDQKGNPLPGTIIERDVTMPQEFDFYLYSHIALQGTSRPVHYTVLADEAKHQPKQLQNMIYEHCYQYMRSTTSVSLHPAVYYSHLASKRAVAHENVSAAVGPQGGPGFKQNQPASSDTPRSSEVPRLISWPQGSTIPYSMWYI